ncbi:MAG: Gfo/Idh/MocA family protein [Candidatus Nanoarchaeia archaeon]
MKKLGVAIIGMGKFGEFLLDAYKKLKHAEVIALCDKKPLQGYKRYKIYRDYNKLLKNKNIDLVVIATPPYLHAKMACQAGKAGKHVLVEKPIALTLREAKQVETACKNVKFKIDYILRENQIIKNIKQIIDSNLLGKIQSINFQNYASDSHLHNKHWFWDKKQSGGIWIEHGVHFFDLFSYLTNKKISQANSLSIKHQGIEDQVSTIAKYDFPATFLHSFTKPYQIEETSWTISFSKGSIHVKGWIPLHAEIQAIITKQEYAKLKKILPVKKQSLKNVKKRDKEIKSNILAKGHINLSNKEKVYKASSKRVMQNLVNNILGKETLDFGFKEAYSSLQQALMAEYS